MGCPSFSDLGKSARDVFKSGFNYGAASCSVTAKARKNLELGGNLKYNFSQSKTTGSASSQFNFEELGKMAAKYSNDGSMSLQYFFDKSLVNDVDLNTVLSFNSETIKSLALNARFATEELNTFCSIVNDHLDVALNGLFAKRGSSQMWTFGVGAKYRLSDGSTLRCKFDKDWQIGLSLQQRLHDSLNLTLSFNIDCANLQGGGHKAGLSLELEA